MNKFEKDCVKTSIIRLARLRCTGSPLDLAIRFGISERTVKRIIKELRDKGIDISYDYAAISYVIKKDDYMLYNILDE
jgi:biotin operon repressor